MQGKGLIIATALFAILGAGVWYSNRQEADKAGNPPADSSPRLIDIQADQFSRIEIINQVTGKVSLQHEGDSWKLTAPQQLPADPDAVSALATTLATFGSEKLIEEKSDDLLAFGLAHPPLIVEATTKDNKTYKLLIGDETPTGGSFYAKLDGDPRVFSTYAYNRTSIDKSWQDLRDKRLITLDDQKISKIEISARGQSFELGKTTAGDWQITRPGPYRADNLQAEEILRRLKDARMDTDVPEQEAAQFPARFAQGTLVAKAVVTGAEGTQQIEVRRSKENYYAKSSAVDGVYQVSQDLGNGLDKSAEDLRNRKLFDFGFSEPTRLEIKDGDQTTIITKSGDDWQWDKKKLDAPSVQQIVDKLRDLSAIKFMTTGFTTSSLEVTVISDSGKKAEKIEITRQGYSWIARRAGESQLYELDGKAIEQLQQSVASLKEAATSAKK